MRRRCRSATCRRICWRCAPGASPRLSRGALAAAAAWPAPARPLAAAAAAMQGLAACLDLRERRRRRRCGRPGPQRRRGAMVRANGRRPPARRPVCRRRRCSRGAQPRRRPIRQGPLSQLPQYVPRLQRALLPRQSLARRWRCGRGPVQPHLPPSERLLGRPPARRQRRRRADRPPATWRKCSARRRRRGRRRRPWRRPPRGRLRRAAPPSGAATSRTCSRCEPGSCAYHFCQNVHTDSPHMWKEARCGPAGRARAQTAT